MVSLATTLNINESCTHSFAGFAAWHPDQQCNVYPNRPAPTATVYVIYPRLRIYFFSFFFLSIVYSYLPFLSLKSVFAPATLVPVLLVMMLATHTRKEIRQENFFLAHLISSSLRVELLFFYF